MSTSDVPPERPDIVAATRGGENSLGMNDEPDPATATLKQALFWRNIYTEILTMEEAVLDRIHQLMASQSPEARREVELTNVPVVVAQVERFRARQGIWDALVHVHEDEGGPAFTAVIVVTDVVASSEADQQDGFEPIGSPAATESDASTNKAHADLGRMGRRHGGCLGSGTDLGIHLAEHEVGQGLLLHSRWIDAPRYCPSARHRCRVAPRRRDRFAANLAATPPSDRANQVLS